MLDEPGSLGGDDYEVHRPRQEKTDDQLLTLEKLRRRLELCVFFVAMLSIR